MSSLALRATALATPLFLGACAVPSGGIFRGAKFRDLRIYQQYGDALLDGRVPYRDFAVEYPPGAVPLFATPSLAPGGAYDALFKALTVVVGIATIYAVCLTLVRLGASRVWVVGSALFLALVPIALGPVSLNTYDAWPAALVAFAAAALAYRRAALALGLLGAAFALKLYPLVLLPLALVVVGRRAAPRALAAFAAVAGLLVVPWVAISPGGVWDSVDAQLGRGLHAESLGASVLLATDRLGWYDANVVRTTHGAVSRDLAGDLPQALEIVSGVLVALAVVAVLLAFRRRGSFGAALAAAIAGALAFTKVVSPQYLEWLVPLVPLAGSLVAAALLVACLALAQAWYFDYPELWAVGGEVWLLLARNALLVALFAVLLWKTRMPSSWNTSFQRASRRRRTTAAAEGIGASRSA
jgi:uncharacterized membrane protein